MTGPNRRKNRADEETAVTIDETWNAPSRGRNGKRGRNVLQKYIWITVPILLLIVLIPVITLQMLTGGSTFTQQKGAVVENVQKLNELVTAEALTKVIIEESDNELFGKDIGVDVFGTKRHLIVVIPGSVKAGVDFSQVHEGDMTIDEEAKKVTLLVPEPEFLGEPEIRFDEVKIYSQEGLFRDRPDIREGYDLAGEAQSMMIQEATEEGVLNIARKNAEEALTKMFSFSDYDVQVKFKE